MGRHTQTVRGYGLQAARIFHPVADAGWVPAARTPPSGATMPIATSHQVHRSRTPKPALDVNDRIRSVSTLLTSLAGTPNDLRLDLCDDALPVHCSPKSLEVALMDSVLGLRHRLAGPGIITVRTRRQHHDAFLTLIAEEFGEATFRFSARRTVARSCDDQHFDAATRLASQAHGRACLRSDTMLVLQLPAVLKPVLGANMAPAASLDLQPFAETLLPA